MMRTPRRSCQPSAPQQLRLVYMSHGPRQNYRIWALTLVLAAVSVNANLVEPVDIFVYHGSLQFSDGYNWPDMKRRIRLAASATSLLHRIWNDPNENPYLSGFGTLNTSLCFRDLDSRRRWYEDIRGLLLDMSPANSRRLKLRPYGAIQICLLLLLLLIGKEPYLRKVENISLAPTHWSRSSS